jgi:hypothetical protein
MKLISFRSPTPLQTNATSFEMKNSATPLSMKFYNVGMGGLFVAEKYCYCGLYQLFCFINSVQVTILRL